jgi:threonine aldolase
MRQAGILAAAGLYALEYNVERLAEDHENAAILAAGLRDLGLKVELPQTNMVYVDIAAGHIDTLIEHLAARGVRASIGAHTRLVTHLDVTRAKIDLALQAFREYPGWSR